jgi:molybdenum cofactor cytidylyltransferase
MGAQKLLLPLGETTLLERAFAASAGLPVVAVVAPALAALIPSRADLTVIVNGESERGMTHSLMLADAEIVDRDAVLVVLLADTPLVDGALVRRVLAERGDADVAYPVRGGIGGHPVVFGPRARAAIASLKEGDTLRALRDDSRFRRVEVPVDDDAPFLDVDTPEDLLRAGALLSARSGTPG